VPHHRSACRFFAVHLGHRRELPDATHRALERCLENQLIAGFNRPSETGVVDADEVHRALCVGIHASGDECEDAGSLRQRLEDHHTRKYRTMRKVPWKEMFIERHILQRANGLARNALVHAIDQEEGIAVRQPPQHFVDVHGQDLFSRLRDAGVSHSLLLSFIEWSFEQVDLETVRI
jgi:hypothetical protein